jgi:hypothetical protein
MWIEIFFVILLIAGIIFAFHGLKLLFQKGYAEKWCSNPADPSGYHYAKYIRGLEGAIMGLMLVGFSLYFLGSHIFLPYDRNAYVKCEAIEVGSAYDEVVAVWAKVGRRAGPNCDTSGEASRLKLALCSDLKMIF